MAYQRTRRTGRIAGSLMAALVLVGCARPKVEPPVPVTGKLVGYRGKSAEGVVVSFWPEATSGGAVKSALCKADGTFSLQCPQGSYKVTLVPRNLVGQMAASAPQNPDSPIPEAYQNSLKTPLRATVPAGGTDKLTLKLSK
jgi:hypothetical protein